MGVLPGIGGWAGGLRGAALVDYVTDTGASITIPVSARAGDVAILVDRARWSGSIGSLFSPSGWTKIVDTSGTRTSVVSSVKLLVGGDPGAIITGVSGDVSTQKILLVFRASAPQAPVLGGIKEVVTDGDPVAQVTDASAGVAPLTVIGVLTNRDGDISDEVFSPAGIRISIGALVVYFRIDVGAGEDTTVDQGGGAAGNITQAFYVQM